MSEIRTLLERRQTELHAPAGSFDRLILRRNRKRRNQRITAAVVGIAVFVSAVWIVTSGLPFDRPETPAATQPTEVTDVVPPVRAVGPVPETDYMLDLNNGEMMPLPKSIVGMEDLTSSYVTSPDGSKLAYARPGPNGSSQIFVANLDGTGVEQVTTDDKATAPDWSPDGSRIAYIGPGGDTNNVFVLDLATGSSTQLTFHTWPKGVANGPYFSPNGSSIRYGVYDEDGHGSHARMVPTSGGESVLGGVYGAQLSPDGTLMSYRCDPIPFTLCLANADGSDARVLLEASDAIGSGRWSPDGTRIAYGTWHSFQAYVVDVATGEQTNVADGVGPVWLDDHTLIVEHTSCLGPPSSWEEKCQG